MVQLCDIIRGSSDVKLRAMGAVLLRRMVLPTSNYAAATPSEVGTALLEALQAEPQAMVRRKISQCIGPISAAHFDSWTELPSVMFGLVASSDTSVKITGWNLIDAVVDFAMDAVFPLHEQILAVRQE